VTWLIGLLNPASAFVKACKAIYDIVMFFVEHGSQILDLVNAIVDSITAIAGGKIDQAADFIEKSLARAIPVIIGFLASLLGVGGISEKIKEVIDKIREPINKAIDWVINKAVGLAKGIGGALGLGGKPDERTEKDKQADLDKAIAEAQALQQASGASEASIKKALPLIKKKYRMQSLDLVVDSKGDSKEKVHIQGIINPTAGTNPSEVPLTSGLHEGSSADPIPIYWYKPEGDYPNSLNLKDPDSGASITAPMSGSTTLDDPRRGRSGDKVTLGVAGNKITPEMNLTRTSGTAGLRTGGQGTLIRVLGLFGYSLSANDQEADHVKDLGFGGVDKLENLWPLKSATNQLGRTYYSSYKVEYLDQGKVATSNLTQLGGKTFKIKGFQWPPPKLPGGRD